MKILFICKHNRFRSKVAEAIFNSLNKNKKIKIKSAGLVIDDLRNYIAENVIKIMKEKGYFLKRKPVQLKARDLNNYDLIIIVADNINTNFLISLGFKGKIIKWNIKDANENEYERIKTIIEKIEEKVRLLTKKLKKD